MVTTTQFNPQIDLNQRLLAAGVSKTVYALVTPETEAAKAVCFGNQGDETRAAFLEEFRDAWTVKQDRYHEVFFETWLDWAAPVVTLDTKEFPFCYPTAGASEPLRHLIFDYAARRDHTDVPRVHIFRGEYEGYKAMAEAAGIEVVEHDRDDWQNVADAVFKAHNELFFLSQPSAIDGDVWGDAPAFLARISNHMAWTAWPVEPMVVMDLTYVGAVPTVSTRFNMNERCIRNVVFSLSKPFGAYYDRIGGVFCREQDLGLFGNKWFKGLTGLRLGTLLMRRHDVFELPRRYRELQTACAGAAGQKLGLDLRPADVYLLATATDETDSPMNTYLRRAGKLRVCVTPAMAAAIGTSGPVQ